MIGKRTTRQAWMFCVLALALLFSLACGSSSGASAADTNSPPDASDATQLDVDTGNHLVTQVCGPAGCEFSTPDNEVKITVPPNALKTETVLWVDGVSGTNSPDFPKNFHGKLYELGPKGQTFEADVNLVLNGGTAKLFNPFVNQYNETTKSWDRLERAVQPGIPDSQLTQVVAKTRTFGIFGVEDRRFLSPQWVVANDTHVFVSNAAVTFDANFVATYHDAWITVIDRKTNEVVRLLKTSQKNANNLLLVDTKLYVVNSGSFSFDNAGTPSSTSDGGLEVFDLSGDLFKLTTSERSLAIPPTSAGRRGAPGKMVLSHDGKLAYLGSSVAPELFVIDMQQFKVQEVLVLSTAGVIEKSFSSRPFIYPTSDEIFVLLGGEDRIVVVDATTGNTQNVQYVIAGVEQKLARPDWLVVNPSNADQLLVMNSVAQTLALVDLQTDLVTDNSVALGKFPNVIKCGPTVCFVVGSGDSAIHKLDSTNLTTAGFTQKFIELPTGSNPYDIAVTTTEGYVTDQLNNAVYVVDLTNGGSPTAEIY